MWWTIIGIGAGVIAIVIVIGIMAAINWALDYRNEAPADIIGDAATLDHPDIPQRQKLKRYEAEPRGA